MAKQIVFEEDARKALLRGIDAVADAVKVAVYEIVYEVVICYHNLKI